jgi:hypothetical protein
VPWVGMLGSSGPTVTNLFPPLILPMETAMRTGDSIGNSCFAGAGRLVCLRRSYGPGEPMPSDNYIALVIGGLAVALVGMALMALYSVAAGAAMTSHLTFTETPDEKRRPQSAMARRGSATERAGTNEPFGS